MIETFGNLNHRAWSELVLFLRTFYEKWVKWCFLLKWCFGSNFIWFWVSFDVYKCLDKIWDQIWAKGFKIEIFEVKNEVFPRAICHNSPWRVNLLAGASCSPTACLVSRSCVFFTHFCFELTFGVNMKVLDNCVSFPVVLVWLENDFYILSYDENTPSRFWRNFKET